MRKQLLRALPAQQEEGPVLRHRRVIEVLRSLGGVLAAVGAALCKALEATRSSSSSIRTPLRVRTRAADCQ
ncbi:hypothetical protein EAG_00908 [Camponotus floridanus]|uniref:Uncharacterized protein n=1 Tax=Camponotus floridanus TaxID=104421 RepID=E2A160_CAMFO|nr:hypothetical protein EAG_00908 [Camponotus floridanus]